jgi:hypothetical protein
MDGIMFEDGTFGRRAVVRSSWSNRFVEELKREGAVELELNQGKGWRGTALSFLAALPELKSFEIFDFNISDISPIHHLCKLRRLTASTYCSMAIDFSAFPELKSCGLEWRPKAGSLFQCATLSDLFLNRYKGKNVNAFARLSNLESLAILNAPIADLQGLRALTKLRSLRLSGLRCLKSLSGVEELANLEELEVHTCRAIRSIDEIRSLTHLKKLHLNNGGKIESLKPLAELTQLESVLFYESTDIVDGDLSPLLRLNNLARVSFQNRRHYSHRREDFGDAYSTGLKQV